MIKHIVESRLNREYGNIINEIDSYMGHKYSETIHEMSKKINIVVANEYFDEENNEKIFLESEPICIKGKNGVDIVMPISYFYLNNGNVVLVHLLLHALLKNKIGNSEIFNEVVVDYMAQEISQKLNEKGINVTICDCPIYSSNSFYSLMFREISDFYESNKECFIDNLMGNEVNFDEDINDIVALIQLKAKNIMLDVDRKDKDNIQGR